MKTLAYDSLASVLQTHVAKGVRKLIFTSSGPREGKSTIAANVARALAQASKQNVLLVDADPFKPTLHKLFTVDNHRGLSDLLKEVYETDLNQDDAREFGLGDWVDILRAQARTGRLTIQQSEDEFSILFIRGKISSIYARQRQEQGLLGNLLLAQGRITQEQQAAALRVHREEHRRLGDVLHGLGYVERDDLESALQHQLKDCLHRMLTLKAPRYQFSESEQAHLPSYAGRDSELLEFPGIHDFITGRFRDYLKQPFLSGETPGYLTDTALGNLKLLTAGSGPCDMRSPAFAILSDGLARTFDVVLFDCPPVALTSPTNGVSALANGVVMVVKAEGYDIQIVQQAKQQLEQTGANVLGVVLNQVRVKQDQSLSYYYGAYRR